MEALEIEGQANQTPLASRGQFTAQGELAEAQHLLDEPDHRFDGAFAGPLDHLAQSRLELVGHPDQVARVVGRRIRQRRPTLFPDATMGLTTPVEVRLDTTSE